MARQWQQLPGTRLRYRVVQLPSTAAFLMQHGLKRPWPSDERRTTGLLNREIDGHRRRGEGKGEG